MATRRPFAKRLPLDAEKIVADSLALAASGSKVEDIFWEKRLQENLVKLYTKGRQASLESAMAHLSKSSMEGFEVLAEQAETASESALIQTVQGPYATLLLAVPILAHTRYQIPAGVIKAQYAAALHQALLDSLVATGAQLSLAPFMYSLDHMPRVHHEVFQLMQLLGQAATVGKAIPTLPPSDIETAPVLADIRFLIAAIAAPQGQPLFRWQEEGDRYAERGDCVKAWQVAGTPTLNQILPACILTLCLPDAFFVSCRESENAMRPVALTAALNYICESLSLTADELSVTIAPFGETQCEEYRIGFSVGKQNDVIYGVIWPCSDEDDLAPEVLNNTALQSIPLDDLNQIRELLNGLGLTNIVILNDLFTPEMCEDCGTPMFANRQADVVHAEMPEEASTQQPLFH